MKCTCGTASTWGKCSSWCDLITAPALEKLNDEDFNPFLYNPQVPFIYTNSIPTVAYPPSSAAPTPLGLKTSKWFRLVIPKTPPVSISDAIIKSSLLYNFAEKEIEDWKKTFRYISSTTNGKEVVDFISHVFEEI